VLEADAEARRMAREEIGRLTVKIAVA